MATVVKSNLFALVNQLELKNTRRYTYKYIGDKLGYSHQSVKNMLSDDYSPDNYIKYGLISKLLDFFTAEGMPIEIADLFKIVETPFPPTADDISIVTVTTTPPDKTE